MGKRRRRWEGAVGMVAALAVLAAVSLPAAGSDGARLGGAITTVRVGGNPDRVAVSGAAVWVGDLGHLSRIDVATGAVVHVPDATTPFAVDAQAVWARLRDGFDSIARLDPATRRVVTTIALGGAPVAVASAESGVWVADSTGTVTRIDPTTNAVTATIPLGQVAFGLAARPDSVWVTGRTASSITEPLVASDASRADDSRPVLWRIDPAANQVTAAIDAPGNCAAVATAATTTYAACVTAQRVDEATGTLVDTTADAQEGLAVGEGAAWALAVDGTVRRVDATTDHVTGSVRVPPGSEGIAAGAGSLWVADPHLHDPASSVGTGTVTRVRLTGTR